jgi:PD-(D/E)XK endonuclease
MSRKRPRTRRPPASRPRTKPPSAASLAASSARHELTTKRRGELAELAFILKAVGLRFAVSKPYGDSERYDFILDPRLLHVGRTLLSAAFDLPAASGKKSAGKKNAGRKNAEKKKAGKKNAEKKNSKQTPPPKQPVIPAAPTPPATSPLLWRVQVKCSTQLLFGLYRVNAHRRINGRAVPYLPSEIDFFAAYIIPEDTWYIIPIAATRGRTTLLFRRKRDPKPGRHDAYREAWHLLRP